MRDRKPGKVLMVGKEVKGLYQRLMDLKNHHMVLSGEKMSA